MMELVPLDTSFVVSALVLAAVIDIVVGEPPVSVHPVVWIGKFIQVLKSSAPKSHRRAYGVFLGLSTILFSSLIGYGVLLISQLGVIPEIIRLLVMAYFLKSTFAIRCLLEPARDIHDALVQGNFEIVREKLPIYVSRDPSKLNREQMSSAVIESTSENLVDGILTPIFYYSLLGPYGIVAAYAYKAVNTLDSMVGYRDEAHYDLGFFSAKLDDVLNWIPARISVLFISAGSLISGIFPGRVSFVDALRLPMSEGANTPSPNSGYPMASISGALGVRLEKPNTYVLGDQYASPVPEDIKRASRVIAISALLSVAVFSVIISLIMGIVNYT